MMPRLARLASVALLGVLLPSARAAAWPPGGVWTDPRGDVVLRRTATGGQGAPSPLSTLPDLVRMTITGWQSPTAAQNPYAGSVVPPNGAHLFRMDVVFAGLVNPPGPLSPSNYDPYQFGPSPVYGFVELDVDGDTNTGGELGAAAKTRYLANIGRFGRLPSSSLRTRAAVWGTQVDGVFNPNDPSRPLYQASGADFVLSLCGCYPVTIVQEGGNGNHIFDAGETWVVRSAFFQRAGGYRDGCFSFGGASGIPGMYDPWVDLRFSHDTARNETTLTLVYALDMDGAGQLAGGDAQDPDYDAGDQTSVQEGLQDVIDGAPFLPVQTPVWHLARRWNDRPVSAGLDVSRWTAVALVGTCASTPQDSSYIWTDTGFGDVAGDVDGDGAIGPSDAAIIRHAIDQFDGGPQDAEGQSCENQSVGIINFGSNFCAYDVDGDGTINARDVRLCCVGDYNGDGMLNVNDFVAFGFGYSTGDPRADVDHSGRLDVNDFVAFGNAYVAGCP